MSQTPAQRLEATLRAPGEELARLPHLTAGYPRRSLFAERLAVAAEGADALVVGVPFSDPTEDGLSRVALHRAALADGASLRWLLSLLGQVQPEPPVVLATCVNPLLAYGLHRLVRDLAELGVGALLVLDLPSEESDELRRVCAASGVGLAAVVTPATSPDRLRRVCHEATGFVCAVGGDRESSWFDRLGQVSRVPVCAAVDDTAQVESFAGRVHGVVLRDSGRLEPR